jgi:hypothetical protein
LNLCQNGFVLVQSASEQLRDHVAGTIIARRAQPSGGDDKVRRLESFGQNGADFRRGVIDGNLPVDQVAVVGQLSAKPLLMRIQDATQHQLGSRVNNENRHNRYFD